MQLLKSSVGRKLVMAATGLLMVLFLVVHLIGNATVYGGPEWLNAYAEHLQGLPPVVYIFRLVMLGLIGLHIWLGIQLTLENRAARPVAYVKKKNIRTTFGAETMIYSGLLILAFVIYHLLHFTVHVTNPEISTGLLAPDHLGRPDVFSMVVLNFNKAGIALMYVVALAVIFIHISHGIQSLFQTFGWNNARTLPAVEKVGKGAGFVLFAGYLSIPILIIFGIVKL